MPGFVSWVHGIVCWVLGFVFWVLGFVFWVSIPLSVISQVHKFSTSSMHECHIIVSLRESEALDSLAETTPEQSIWLCTILVCSQHLNRMEAGCVEIACEFDRFRASEVIMQ